MATTDEYGPEFRLRAFAHTWGLVMERGLKGLVTNGGIRFSLKAHAICGHCTECDDFTSEIHVSLDAFKAGSQLYFEKTGWKFQPGQKVRCPTCARTKRSKKEEG